MKWVLGIALGLAMTGQLKSATLRMAEMAVEAREASNQLLQIQSDANCASEISTCRH
jgi:hypothetical protein